MAVVEVVMEKMEVKTEKLREERLHDNRTVKNLLNLDSVAMEIWNGRGRRRARSLCEFLINKNQIIIFLGAMRQLLYLSSLSTQKCQLSIPLHNHSLKDKPFYLLN